MVWLVLNVLTILKRKKARISKAEFIPTITYYDASYNNYALYTIKEWNNTLAQSHEVTVSEGQDLSKKYVQNYVKDVMKNVKGVKVVLK